MANPGTVDIVGSVTGTTAVVTVTFAAAIGAIYLLNTGSNPVWVTLDGLTAPIASNGANRFCIAAGASFNLEDATIPAIKAISTAAFALQYVAMRRGS